MDDLRPLIDDLYRRRVERARRMDPGQKAMDGARLFDEACRVTMSGIRAQFPDADEHEVLRILRERIRMRTERENRK